MELSDNKSLGKHPVGDGCTILLLLTRPARVQQVFFRFCPPVGIRCHWTCTNRAQPLEKKETWKSGLAKVLFYIMLKFPHGCSGNLVVR
jgi:hypothetical protein